jgi:hypothetical protein
MSLVRAGRLGICLVVPFLATTALAQPIIRTADPAKRGLTNADFPRTIKITDNVYIRRLPRRTREVHNHPWGEVRVVDAGVLARADCDPEGLRRAVLKPK